jgi:hypothetical protein
MSIRQTVLAGLALAMATACGTAPLTAPPAGDTHGFQIQQATGWGGGSGFGGYGGYGGYGAMMAPGGWGNMGPWGGMSGYGLGGSPWPGMAGGFGPWGGQTGYGNWTQTAWGQPGWNNTDMWANAGSQLNPQTMSMLVTAVLQALKESDLMGGLGAGQFTRSILNAK